MAVPDNRSRLKRFALAIAAPVAITILVQLSWPLFEQTPTSLYFAAVTVAAWYGGLLPGLLSVAVSFLVADYLFVAPYFALWPPRTPDMVHLLTLASVGACISVLSESMHRAIGRAHSNLLGVNIDITERKQAETRLRAQLGRMSLLEQITRATGDRQDLASLFQVVVDHLEEDLPLDFACICSYDPAAAHLTVATIGRRSTGLAGELGLADESNIPIDQNGLAACVRGRLVYEPEIAASDAPFPRRLAAAGLGSLVIAPLAIKDAVFGVLVAARRTVLGFTSQDCEFLRQLSEHVALASHQVSLHRDLQAAYDDLRRTQQQVTQQERLRALGQMASGIAHDINNALSPIALYTNQLLEVEPGLTAYGRGCLQTIERAIDDISQTIARLREFYRLGEEHPTSPVRLNDLVLHVKELTRARWNDMPQQRGVVIQVGTELAADLPRVMGQESDIRDALVNLLFNAVDALPAGGTILIRTLVVDAVTAADAPPRPRIALEVVDTGTGMDEATRRRCLEPFFTTKGERGTGLGLAMVYGMAQRHDAAIELESEVGKGTTVRVLFPLQDPAPAAPANAETRRPRPLRILLVDDDLLLLKALTEILESDGHEVVAVGGGQAGIDAFAAALRTEAPIELVITDLGIPHVDGRQVSAAIKGLSPRTPILLLTGWGERLEATREVPPHVDRLLSKPPRLRELRTTIADLTS